MRDTRKIAPILGFFLDFFVPLRHQVEKSETYGTCRKNPADGTEGADQPDGTAAGEGCPGGDGDVGGAG